MLTDHQKKMVEENINLSYQLAHELYRRDNRIPLEDLIQIMSVGLCIAAKTFNPERGYKFSTLAYTCMQNEYRKIVRKKKPKTISIDEKIVGTDLCFKDILEYSGTNLEESIEAAEVGIDFDLFMGDYSDIDKSVMRLSIEGWKGVDIAKKLGISFAYVSYIIRKIRPKFSQWYQAA